MLDTYTPTQNLPEYDMLRNLTDKERTRFCLLQIVSSFSALLFALAAIAIIYLLSSCTTPKTIHQHHHHYEQTDTLAIQARIDRAVNSWHAQMDSSWRKTWQDYRASWFSHDEQKEHITETITTYIDSLGREVRKEQRTTDRSLSKIQQQTEQRLSREFEHRIRIATDSISTIFQQRFDLLKAHWERSDSTNISITPTSQPLPWYKRWWHSLKDYIILTIITLLFIIISRIFPPKR